MATRIPSKDAPAPWREALGHRDPASRDQRVAELRELVARGAYKVNLDEVAAAVVRRGGLLHGADPRVIN
jgi:hypothetical protein